MNNADQPAVLLIHQQSSIAADIFNDSSFQIIECHTEQLSDIELSGQNQPAVILIEGNPNYRLISDLQDKFHAIPRIVLSHNLSLNEQLALAELGIDDVIFDYDAQAVIRRIQWHIRRSSYIQPRYTVNTKLMSMMNLIRYMQSQATNHNLLAMLQEAFELQRVLVACLDEESIQIQEYSQGPLFQIRLGISNTDPLAQILSGEETTYLHQLSGIISTLLLAANPYAEHALVIPFSTLDDRQALILIREVTVPFTEEDTRLFELFTIHYKQISRRQPEIFRVNRRLLPLWRQFAEINSAEALTSALYSVLCEHRKIRNAIVWTKIGSQEYTSARNLDIVEELISGLDTDVLYSLVDQPDSENLPLLLWKNGSDNPIKAQIYDLLAIECFVVLPIITRNALLGCVLAGLEPNQFMDDTDLITIENQIFTAALAIDLVLTTRTTATLNTLESLDLNDRQLPKLTPHSGAASVLQHSTDRHSGMSPKSHMPLSIPPHYDHMPKLLTIGQLQVNLESRMVFLNEKLLKLTRIEYELLSYLAIKANQIVNHEELLQRVWGPEFSDAKQYLWVTVSRLRKKLHLKNEMDYIHNRPGIGYMLRSPSG